MNNSFRILSLLATGLAIVGCQDFENGFSSEDVKKAAYAKNFEKVFGTPDPNQDWSMATLVKANVNLPGITGTAKMNICTGDPRLSSTRLLAQIMLKDGKGSIDFDAIKGSENVFVTVEQDGEYKVFSQYAFKDGMLNVGQFSSVPYTRSGVGNVTPQASFSSTCPTEKGDVKTVDVVSFTTNEKIGLTYNGETHTLLEWKDLAKDDAYIHWDGNTNYNKSPFTDESILTFHKMTDINWGGLSIISEETKVKDLGNGSYRWYRNADGNDANSVDLTLDEWKAEALANLTNILSGSYTSSIWDVNDLREALIWSDCEKGDDGAIFNGLSADNSLWILKPEVTDAYRVGHPQLQYLTGVEQVPADPWALGFGYNLFGDGAVFAESVPYYSSEKVALYGNNDLQTMERGFEVLTDGTPIELPYIFGCTSYANQFGYVYWKDGEDPLTKKHYVLMEDARPSSNITWGDGSAVGGEELSNWNGMNVGSYTFTWLLEHKGDEIQCYCQKGSGIWSEPYGTGAHGPHTDQCASTIHCYCGAGVDAPMSSHQSWCPASKPAGECNCNRSDVEGGGGHGIYSSEMKHLSTCQIYMDMYLKITNKQVCGTSYRVMYFGDNGEYEKGVYNFPAGYHVAFWIDKLGSEADLTEHSGYQVGNYNYSLPELNERIGHLNSKHVTPGGPTGMVKCITWSLDGTTYMGFGDNSGDEDLNDIVFIVKGGVPQNVITVAPIKWHLNYNGTHDVTDSDLYYQQSLGLGVDYTQPAGTPTNMKKEFLGWSTTPTGATGYSKTINATVTSADGMCYYAIWKDDKVAIKWHMNLDESHHTNDDDLYYSEKLAVGAIYTEPDGTPAADGKIFLGWSTTPDNSSDDIFTSLDPTEVPEGGKCYYAIWGTIIPGPDPEPITWILACEDLGGSFDYDFNDVVWSVKTTWNEGVASTKVKVLAAGGTLGFTLKYNSTEICTKANAFTISTTDDQIVNAGASNGVNRTSNEFTLTPAITTISTEWENFSVVVKNHGDSQHVVQNIKKSTENSKAPQIILLPEEWEWPTELTPINEAYTNFNTWVTNNNAATWESWSATKVSGKTVSR